MESEYECLMNGGHERLVSERKRQSLLLLIVLALVALAFLLALFLRRVDQLVLHGGDVVLCVYRFNHLSRC